MLVNCHIQVKNLLKASKKHVKTKTVAETECASVELEDF